MVLKTPVTADTSALDVYVITEVPDAIPRDRWKRPLIVPRDGGPPVAYTRASTLGKAIDDTYHLNLWKLRTVVYGMSRNKVLVAQASAVETNEGDDRKLLDEIAEKAHEAGKGNVGADIGTALHKLSERADKGEDMSWLAAELHDAIFVYLEQMKIFKVLAAETFVACDEVQSAGSFDRVVMLLVDLEFNQNQGGKIVKVIIPAGTVLVVDLKTGKASSAKYWGPTYGVQQTVYACGEPYLPGQGRITWEELLGEGLRPSTDWALILHVPGDKPADAGLMVVDLEDGRALADLAVAVRQARKIKSLLTDAWPVIDQVETPAIEQGPAAAPIDQAACTAHGPHPGTADCPKCLAEQAVSALERDTLMDLIQQAECEDDLGHLWEKHGAVWTEAHTAAVKVRIAELRAAAPVSTPYVEMAPEPAQVAKTRLMAKLREAASEEELTALWEANSTSWDAACTALVKARVRELSAGAPA